MSVPKQAVKVTILGDDYSLRSTTSAEETTAIAKSVDQSIREIMQSGSVVETHKAAILACLRLAGELAAARKAAGQVTEEMQALAQEIRPWLPPAKRHD